ncbi:MAG: response regulator [Rhodospirillaceae bacterium]
MARILVVEDALEVRESIKDSLEDAGFTVEVASDGVVALDIQERQPCDLVITDLWMPNMDGLDLLKRLRAINPKLPVIAISGGAPRRAPIDYSVALADTWGADRVLHKPFDNDDLVEEVKKLLAQYAGKVP